MHISYSYIYLYTCSYMYVNIIEYTKVIMYLYHVCLEDHGSNIIFLY